MSAGLLSSQSNMSSGKKTLSSGGNNAHCSTSLSIKLKASTPGLEAVLFHYDGIGRSTTFKQHLKSLARHMLVIFNYEALFMVCNDNNDRKCWCGYLTCNNSNKMLDMDITCTKPRNFESVSNTRGSLLGRREGGKVSLV